MGTMLVILGALVAAGCFWVIVLLIPYLWEYRKENEKYYDAVFFLAAVEVLLAVYFCLSIYYLIKS